MDNMEIWNKVKQAPPHALKTIGAGRLKGYSSIDPQWRYQALTEQFGPCGEGWKYEIVNLWVEQGSDGQVFAFSHVNLFLKTNEVGVWGDPIPGVGGSMLVAKEKAGLYSNDEAFKMATTDALSVACKALGIAADVYMGLWDGSKYKDTPKETEFITDDQANELAHWVDKTNSNPTTFLKWAGAVFIGQIATDKYTEALSLLKERYEKQQKKKAEQREPGDDDQ